MTEKLLQTKKPQRTRDVVEVRSSQTTLLASAYVRIDLCKGRNGEVSKDKAIPGEKDVPHRRENIFGSTEVNKCLGMLLS